MCFMLTVLFIVVEFLYTSKNVIISDDFLVTLVTSVTD
jgi:hypothetical protein